MTAMTDEYAVNTGSSGDLTMVRLDSNGADYKEPFAFEDYDPIDKGMVDFEITGFQTRFEMNRPAAFMKPNPKTGEMPSPTQPKTRLEFTIINGPQAGKRWLGLYTWAVGEQSSLGQLIRMITQQDIPRGWRMTDVIGLTGRGYVRHSTDKEGKVKTDRDGNPYADLSVDTVEPITAEATAPQPQPSTKTVVGSRPKASPPASDDPRLSWTALWNELGRWGITNIKQAEQRLNRKFANTDGPGEVYDAVMAAAGEPVEQIEAPF